MDLEIRQLYRSYKAEPSWDKAYHLIRKNQRLTGELISEDNLRFFARRHLFRPFLRAIEKLHDSAYPGEQTMEWDLYDSLKYNAILVDNEAAAHQGLTPKLVERPFTYVVTLILEDDVIYGNQGIGAYVQGLYAGARPDSIAFNRRVSSGLAGTLSSNTRYELIGYLRRNFGYSSDYLYDSEQNAWGYVDVIPIPKDEWDPQTKTSRSHLFLIYTFYPDAVLWDLLLRLELE